MNRITQLTIESDLIEWDILPSGARTPNHESVVKAQKFADLIVQECVQAVYDDGQDAEYYQNRIKNHFGVE